MEHLEEEEFSLNWEWMDGRFLFQGKEAVPKIYQATLGEKELPEGFNAVAIPLDATVHSTLQWKDARDYARFCVDRGYSIVWDLNFGIFTDLPELISNPRQSKTLHLAIDELRETLWEEFEKQCLGVCFYKGSLDFSLNESIDLEESEQKSIQERRLDSRDQVVELLEQLSSGVPMGALHFVLLDAPKELDPWEAARLLCGERFQHFCVGIRGEYGYLGHFSWNTAQHGTAYWGRDEVKMPPLKIAERGICIPSMGRGAEEFGKLIRNWIQEKIPFRTVPEMLLPLEWQELNELHVWEPSLSDQGERNLSGFEAAGGKVFRYTETT